MTEQVPGGPDLRTDYLELLGRALLGLTNGPLTIYRPAPVSKSESPLLRRLVQRQLLRRGHAVLAYPTTLDLAADPEGRSFVTDLAPSGTLTMVGKRRLDNTRSCVIDVIERGVPGDLIETGVWRGGTTILMRGVLRAYGVTDRSVYVADSFAGLPAPNPVDYPEDKGIILHEYPALAVPLNEVRANFERYGLLDDQVVFVKGWFRDTLPGLRGHTWAVIRLDGDLYESTTDALSNLYADLSVGGWTIIDDYDIGACRAAVHDFRDKHAITEEIVRVDAGGVCWRKLRPAG